MVLCTLWKTFLIYGLFLGIVYTVTKSAKGTL